MKTVIQRVRRASVSIEGRITAEIGEGLLILVGIEDRDTSEDVEWLTKKITNLRIFNDEDGVMNKSLLDLQAEVLVVSQFTLQASVKKGNRPSYIKASKPLIAIPLYELFCKETAKLMGKEVATGQFGADMQIALINDGPVTLCIDSQNKE
jgi:D-tyrosyl-tRNA(Tyr) deacylase